MAYDVVQNNDTTRCPTISTACGMKCNATDPHQSGTPRRTGTHTLASRVQVNGHHALLSAITPYDLEQANTIHLRPFAPAL